MRLKNHQKKFKLLSLFLILLVIMFAYSSIVEGNNINEPVWAFPGAYVKYFEKGSSVIVFGNGTKTTFANATGIGLYKILSVNLKNQTFSYLQSVTYPPVVYYYSPNYSCNYKFINSTFNYSFSEYFNTTGNPNQPITIFFINQKTMDELNKGFVPGALLTAFSSDIYYPSLPGNSANATGNLTLSINNEIYPVIKVQVKFYNKIVSSFGNTTVYIDKYSGIIVKWNTNLTELGPLKSQHNYANMSIILFSTNIPMGALGQINYYFILALSIGVILVISITFIYFKKKNK